MTFDRKGVYVRATNIRDAARILDSREEKPKDWTVECVSAEEVNEVSLFTSIDD